MPNNLKKIMRGKSIMGLDFSKFEDSEEEEIPELVDAESENYDKNYFEEKTFKKASKRSGQGQGNGRKSKRASKGSKKTRKQVRFS